METGTPSRSLLAAIHFSCLGAPKATSRMSGLGGADGARGCAPAPRGRRTGRRGGSRCRRPGRSGGAAGRPPPPRPRRTARRPGRTGGRPSAAEARASSQNRSLPATRSRSGPRVAAAEVGQPDHRRPVGQHQVGGVVDRAELGVARQHGPGDPGCRCRRTGAGPSSGPSARCA